MTWVQVTLQLRGAFQALFMQACSVASVVQPPPSTLGGNPCRVIIGDCSALYPISQPSRWALKLPILHRHQTTATGQHILDSHQPRFCSTAKTSTARSRARIYAPSTDNLTIWHICLFTHRPCFNSAFQPFASPSLTTDNILDLDTPSFSTSFASQR